MAKKTDISLSFVCRFLITFQGLWAIMRTKLMFGHLKLIALANGFGFETY